jgi:hypothetical protein
MYALVSSYNQIKHDFDLVLSLSRQREAFVFPYKAIASGEDFPDNPTRVPGFRTPRHQAKKLPV